ncbi:MAG: hypothetical protein NVS2B17_16700 [Candidatus Velthaea sp.]
MPLSRTDIYMVRRLEAILILGASFGLAAFVVANKRIVDDLLHALGPFAIPAAIIVFAVVAAAPFSVTDALAVSNGVLFGPWLGSFVNACGIVLAAIIGYAIALRTAKLLNIEEQVQKLPGWVRRFKVGSPMFLIVVRLIPGMGGTIATQTAAALHISLWRQIYTMAAVAIPVCTALAFGGHVISTYVQTNVVVPAEHYAQRHHLHLRSPHAIASP